MRAYMRRFTKNQMEPEMARALLPTLPITPKAFAVHPLLYGLHFSLNRTRCLIFDDAYEHEVRCSTGDGDCAQQRGQESTRLILVVDVLHPAAAHDQMA